MTLFFASMIIVISLEFKNAEQTFDVQCLPAFALLFGFWNKCSISPINSVLKQKANQGIGRFENRRTNKRFDPLDQQPSGCLTMKILDQFLDLLFLGEEDLGLRIFFFNPLASSSRV